MTSGQQDVARKLLRESLDWIGILELDAEEEQQAGCLQARIERLLVEVGEMGQSRKEGRFEAAYRLVLVTRAREAQAREERDISRKAVNHELAGEAKLPDERAGYFIKRHQLAYTWWEEAERARQAAEGVYFRVLSQGGR